jgi:hypothetical protein
MYIPGRARALRVPFSRPPAVNSGHSSHVPTLTPSSAFTLVTTLINARPSKLVLRATLPSCKDATLPNREDAGPTDFGFNNLRDLHYVTQAG